MPPLLIFLSRGGIAAVWLGKNPDGDKVAVKQFVKKKNGEVDNSVVVEYQMHALIREKASEEEKE